MRCWIGLKERLLVRKELVATLSVLITNLEPSEENYTALQLVVKERGKERVAFKR
jgi:hypothetical protein